VRLKISDIKKGDKFCEYDCGHIAFCEAMEDAIRVEAPTRDGWELPVKIEFRGTTSESVFFESVNAGAYGLKLYTENEFRP